MGAINKRVISLNTVEKPELKSAKLLYALMYILLVADWVVPSYLGVHILFDFTVTRVLNIIILLYFFYNRKAGNHFLKSMFDVEVTPFLLIYMAIMILITVLRANINTFFFNFLDILTFYMLYYGIRYVLGIKKAIDITVKSAWFIGIYGLIEYVLGYSPMVKFLMTVPSPVKIVFRSGEYRTMGPCLHPIAFGMVLLMLICIICIDYEKEEIYLFKRPVLLVILALNVFLTGSRGPLGFLFVEIFLIVLLSKREVRRKTIFYLLIFAVLFVVFEILIINTSLGRYIMMQITSVVDEVFGTSYSVKWGADLTLLSQSSDYRDYLPRIFTVEWLNPLLGQGTNASVGFEFDGVYIHSIDNFYVATYIRYAYPGLVAWVLFQIMSMFYSFKCAIKRKSGICMAIGIALMIYYINLYYADYLMTSKYMFILLSIYAAFYSLRYQEEDRTKRKIKRRKSNS